MPCTRRGMSTKAERFREEEQRQNRTTRAKKARPRRDAPVDTAERRVSADKRRAGAGDTALRNLLTSEARQKGGPALEGSTNGKPSRKSTRASAGHVKLASNLQRRQIRRTHSPAARAARARAQ